MSMHEQSVPRVGLAVVVARENRVLILKRQGAHGSGTWSLPGGHVEFGESWEMCAQREVEEETGLTISDCTFLGVTDDYDIGENKHYVTIFMKANAVEGEPRICEPDRCAHMDWFAWEEIPLPRFSPLQKLIHQGIHPLAISFNKLVRDRIPEIIASHGEVAVVHEATAEEYKRALHTKLIEELEEYLNSEDPEELADLLEVVHGITALLGTTREELLAIKQHKRDKRGGFEKRIILESTHP